jgi:AbrB family looped-hinge helix DNA binding protein
MSIGESRITTQGQVTVPAAVRKALGVGPGSTLEWTQEGNQLVVRRKAKYDSEDVHRALFGDKKPKRRTLKQLNEAKARYASARYARSK